MTSKRSRIRTWKALWIGALALGLGACASTVHIEKLLGNPQEYDGRTVQVSGTVTRSAGLLGVGAYQIDDGTGTIVVIAQGQGVPREGSDTKVKGTFHSVFSFMGNTIAAIVQPERESP